METRLARLLRAGADLEAVDKHGHTALEAVVTQGWESEKSGQVIDVLVRAGARWDHIDPHGGIEPLRSALWGHPWVRRAQLLGRARAGANHPTWAAGAITLFRTLSSHCHRDMRQ